MNERNQQRINFLGTYFNPSFVNKVALLARIAAWFVLGVFLFEGGVGFLAYILMQIRHVWYGLGLTDSFFYLSPYLEKVALGIFFFIVLLGMASLLEIFLDVEDNTRRAARNVK